ncbi:dihydropyrimidinase [Clostridia bacterium]|nr:dihydropyrimidinase [Clostridia bacterium]
MALLIKNGKVFLEHGLEATDLKIVDGKFSAIGTDMLANSQDQVIDAGGKLVLPGLIDAHVHYKMGIGNVFTIDNFETGSRAALFGGVTTIVDYAEPTSGVTMSEALALRKEEAHGASFVDYTFHVVSSDVKTTKKELEKLKAAGVNSLKLFTIYDQRMPYEEMERIIAMCSELDLVVTIHAEDEPIIANKIAVLTKEGKTAPRYHGVSRPVEAEVHAVERIIEIVRKYDTHVHIVHVSAGETANRIKAARKEGVNISGETCPHYLLLNEKAYERDDAQLYIMQPPLRSEEERRLLWENVAENTLDMFTTDHCSYCAMQKFNGDTFFETNGGIPGTETLFPCLHTAGVGEGKISFETLIKMLSENPAKTFGIYPRKGVIRVGSDADLVIFDPEKEVTISKETVHTAAQYSTFDGMKLKGYPVATVLRGQLMCQDGKFVQGEPIGEFVETVK